MTPLDAAMARIGRLRAMLALPAPLTSGSYRA